MKTQRFALAWMLLALMTAAALLRLMLAQDFPHLTLTAPDGSRHLFNGLLLLAYPATQAAAMLAIEMSLWQAKSSGATVRAWRDYWGAFNLALVLFMAVGLALLLLSSFGIAIPVSPGRLRLRIFVVLLGMLLVAMFNRFPKLPPLRTSSSPRDPARWLQTARLISWIVVGLGLLMILTGLVGPTPQTAPFLSAALTSFVALALLAIVWQFWRWHGAPR